MRSLRPYLAIASARARLLLQYRAAAAAGFVTQLFWGFVKVMVFEAFYRSATGEAMPMSLPEVVAYVWLGQAMLRILPWNIDQELAHEVRTGEVVYALLRPIDLYAQWFSRTVALRAAPTLLRAVPMFLFAIVVLPLIGAPEWALGLPPSLASFGVWVLAMIIAVLLSAALTMLWNVSMLWTISGDGATHLAPALVIFFSGMLIPLPLFPDAMQEALMWLPFAGIFDLPARIYIGHLSPLEALPLLLRQAGWAVVLILSGRGLLKLGVRRMVFQGG